MGTPLNERRKLSKRAVKVYSTTQSGMMLGLGEIRNIQEEDKMLRKEWRDKQRKKG